MTPNVNRYTPVYKCGAKGRRSTATCGSLSRLAAPYRGGAQYTSIAVKPKRE